MCADPGRPADVYLPLRGPSAPLVRWAEWNRSHMSIWGCWAGGGGWEAPTPTETLTLNSRGGWSMGGKYVEGPSTWLNPQIKRPNDKVAVIGSGGIHNPKRFFNSMRRSQTCVASSHPYQQLRSVPCPSPLRCAEPLAGTTHRPGPTPVTCGGVILPPRVFPPVHSCVFLLKTKRSLKGMPYCEGFGLFQVTRSNSLIRFLRSANRTNRHGANEPNGKQL